MEIKSRNRKLAINTVTSLLFQLTTVICGFILPRLILKAYGSEVNGLVISITQFLGLIAFLELGVGAVVQSSLYKPLSEKDTVQVSKIMCSANKFFKRIAEILILYVVILFFVYPIVSNQEFGFVYTALLIGAVSISSFAQYYFGIVNRLLLSADQRGYVHYISSTATLIMNTVACAILIYCGASIHIVKLTTSCIYLLRPLILKIYVDKNYSIDKRIKYSGEPIKQKWNGVAQHIAAVVLDGTDTVVLTLFATLSDVSIYSVYFMVVSGVKNLFLSMTGGIQAVIGELWAKQDIDELRRYFSWTEWIIHTGTTFVFSCTGILILPFVSVYTKGITDAVYFQPLFAVLITTANAGHCLRLPYNIMILAGGHYKETQNNYVIAMTLNVVLSIVLVKFFGLIGVAIGTLVAMLYQTVWMALYNSKNLLKWPITNFIKQFIIDILTVIVIAFATCWITLKSTTYLCWIVMALEIVLVSVVAIVLINFVFYRDKIIKSFSVLIRKFKR